MWRRSAPARRDATRKVPSLRSTACEQPISACDIELRSDAFTQAKFLRWSVFASYRDDYAEVAPVGGSRRIVTATTIWRATPGNGSPIRIRRSTTACHHTSTRMAREEAMLTSRAAGRGATRPNSIAVGARIRGIRLLDGNVRISLRARRDAIDSARDALTESALQAL
jgi:hypothetical protein